MLVAVSVFIVEQLAHIGEPWSTALRDTASAIFTTGGVAVVYELSLKASFAIELMRLVGIRDDVRSSGFLRVVGANAVQWTDVITSASHLDLLVGSPYPKWDWQDILAAARSRKADVALYLPDPECGEAT